jgi:hypothetical protein
MNKPREWYQEIIYWANGGEIERYDAFVSEWEDDPHPDFWSYNQYRKKEEVPTYWCYRQVGETIWKAYNDMKKYTRSELTQDPLNSKNLEFQQIF